MLKWRAMVSMFLLVVLCGIFLLGSACFGNATCGVCGTYVNQNNPSEYLELKADDTFYLEEYGMAVHGTWEIEGDTITLKLEGIPTATKGTIHGNTIIDGEGKVWVKQ